MGDSPSNNDHTSVGDRTQQGEVIHPQYAVVIRFSGDSGDGMQLTGDQFTNTSAILGNDVSTFPDFPAEIRAPVGTVPGLSDGKSTRLNSVTS